MERESVSLPLTSSMSYSSFENVWRGSPEWCLHWTDSAPPQAHRWHPVRTKTNCSTATNTKYSTINKQQHKLTMLLTQLKTLPSWVRMLPTDLWALPTQLRMLQPRNRTLPTQLRTLSPWIRTLPTQLRTLPSRFRTLQSLLTLCWTSRCWFSRSFLLAAHSVDSWASC